MAKVLMKGSEAIAEAALQAGCKAFFGYPITPQNQIPEYMSKRMPQIEGCSFIQAESEVAAINMVYGAAGAGARVMTSSSSPGVSLKQEGISYIACAELPCLVVNVMRSGPGLGGILPSQGDYFQAAKGGGHGDYHMIVLAPSSVQEAADMVMDGFDLADRYRTPVMILADGMIGQMMEPVEIRPRETKDLPEKTWAATGWDGHSRDRAIVTSLYISPESMTETSDRMKARYREIEEKEVQVQEYMTEDADYIIAAFGTIGRIARKAANEARAQGLKVGVIRPKTVWPFPYKTFEEAAKRVKGFLTVEMNHGQMLEDVKIGVAGQAPVEFLGTVGGNVPDTRAIVEAIRKMEAGSNG
ncbi:MAG: 3-methyl-2-oxobutanoate dehydrogenase subunit VorB [Clostridia bacterium]|nr:3-methyl-2-oxobutanoate dehydrogenase subunit VorB [Clostridia bacterium]